MNRKSSLLLPLGIIIMLFALLVGGDVPYFLLYSYALFLLLPFIFGIFAIRRLSGSISIPGMEFKKGDKILIEYSIRNKTPFTMPSLLIINSTTKSITGKEPLPVEVSLQGGGLHTGRENIIANRRGYYSSGDLMLVSTDCFGIYSLRRRISSPTELIIYPDPNSLSSFRISASREAGDLVINNLSYRDRSRIESLREFREGDSIKAIHWSQSAAKETIIVKEFEKRGDSNAVIFIDNNKDVMYLDIDRRLEDLEVDIALGIISHCLEHGVSVSLIQQDGRTLKKAEGSFIRDMKPFLKLLAMLSSNGILSIEEQLEREASYLSRGTNIIIISPLIDVILGKAVLGLISNGLNPIVIGVSDIRNKTGYVENAVETRLRQEGVPIFLIDYSSDFEKTLEEAHV